MIFAMMDFLYKRIRHITESLHTELELYKDLEEWPLSVFVKNKIFILLTSFCIWHLKKDIKLKEEKLKKMP